MQPVGVRRLVLHKDGLNDCGQQKTQPIAVIQSFESYCVLDYEFSRLVGLHLEIDLDADGGDDDKDGSEDLSYNAKTRQSLVPFKARRTSEKCFVLCER